MRRDALDSRVDFRPTADWDRLRLRAELLRRLRDFFHARGFLEVETPVLSADIVVDRHIEPFALSYGAGSCGAGVSPAPAAGTVAPQEGMPARLWLQTSPEFHMKRMLAAGATAIYQVCRVFRRDEIGPLHNPEFTMVEWYRTGDDQASGMQFTSDLCEAMLARGPAERISYAQAFERYIGVDPHTAEIAALSDAARRYGVVVPESFHATEDRDGWLDLLLAERVQPHLGHDRPTLMYDYPASQAALAVVRGLVHFSADRGRLADTPLTESIDLSPSAPVAERFELYIDGVEIANGYHELLDAGELRRRNAAVNALREADGKPHMPEESRLLAAMEAGMPPAVGVALGFDRLVMAAAGAKEIREVIAFPMDRA